MTKTPPETPRARHLPGATALIARLDAAAAMRNDPHARWRVDFPTAVALLEAWEKPWASKLQNYAKRRVLVCAEAGLLVMSADEVRETWVGWF